MTFSVEDVRKLNELIDAYWDCAYAEGELQGRYDTPQGDAQRIRSEISAMLERQPTNGAKTVDIYEAYKTWPQDIRAKLSLHDLRRMNGWSPRGAVGDWCIDTSTPSPILTYQKCSVIQDEQATYVLGLIRNDAVTHND